MGMQPLQDWILIEPSEAKEKTAGGVIIPDTAKEKPVEGKVLAVGKGRWETPEKKWGSKPKGKEERSSSLRSSNRAIRSSTRKTEQPQSIWTVRNSFSSASPTSWAGTTKAGSGLAMPHDREKRKTIIGVSRDSPRAVTAIDFPQRRR